MDGEGKVEIREIDSLHMSSATGLSGSAIDAGMAENVVLTALLLA